MRIYFVRHAETILSQKDILSESGKRQAEKLALRLCNIEIDRILTSSDIYAKQTADIVAKSPSIPIEADDLLRSGDAVKMEIEQFPELIEQGKAALNYLETKNDNSLLVISHGLLIRILVGIMTFEENFDAEMAKKMLGNFHIHISGITVCEKTNGSWKLLTWNDYEDLG